METENPNTKQGKTRMRWGRLIALVVGILLLGSLFVPVYEQPTCVYSNYTRNISNVNQLVMALKVYALDHDGAYPVELGNLVNEDILDEKNFGELCRIKFDDIAPDTEWIYVRGLNDSSPANRVLIVSPPLKSTVSPNQETRIFAQMDGSVQKMREAKFQEYLVKTGQMLPDPPPAKGNKSRM